MSRDRRHSVSWLTAAIVALCLAGAGLSGELVRQHGGATGGLLARLCHAADGSGAGCTGTLHGPFSELRIPLPRPTRDLSVVVRTTRVPVAFLGLAYFVFLGLWYVVAGPGRPWHRLPLHVAYAGLAMSILYVGLMAVGSAPWCVGCVAVHAVNLLLVAAVWRISTAPRPDRAAAVTARQAFAAGAVALAVIGGLWLFRRDNLGHRAERERLATYQQMVHAMQRDPEFLMREYFAQAPTRPIPLRPTEVVPDGAAKLVVFTDFECPACYCNAGLIKNGLERLFKDRIAVLVRHYPLCAECNDGVQGVVHPHACRAACAAEAARRLGGEAAFAQMHYELFMHRGRLGDETYREIAAGIGLDPDRLLAEMDGDAVRQIIADDIALARELGVAGTPAMFLDDRPLPDVCETPLFWNTYAERLAPAAQTELARPRP
jgi:protein-disulfide isomerase